MIKYGSIIVVLFISIILGIKGGTGTGFISQFTNCQIVKAENVRNPSDIPDIICNILCKEYGSNQIISTVQMTKEPAQNLNVDYLLDFSKLKEEGLYYFEVIDSSHNSYQSNIFRTYRDYGKKMCSGHNTMYDDGNYIYIKTTVHGLLPNDKYALQLNSNYGFDYYVIYETPIWTANSESKTVTMRVPKSSLVNGACYSLLLVYVSSTNATTSYHDFVYPDNVENAPAELPSAETNETSNTGVLVPNEPSQPTASVLPSETNQPNAPSSAPTINPTTKPLKEKDSIPSLDFLNGYVNSRKSVFKIPNANSFSVIKYKLVKKGKREDKLAWITAHDGTIKLKGEGKYSLVVQTTNAQDSVNYNVKSKVFTLDTVKPTIKKTYSKKGIYVLTIKDSGSGIKSVKVNNRKVVTIKNVKSKTIKIKVKKGIKVVVTDKAGNQVNYVVK